jgi:hypothetical protein
LQNPIEKIGDRINSMTQEPQLSLSEQTAAQAEFIVNNFRETHYRHPVNIDVDRGVYICDCNGFVGFVLERFAPAHFAMIPKEEDQPRPRAFEYYVFFSSLTPHSTGGWHQIDLLRDVRRGDGISWRLPKVEEHHDTGHVLFAAETPVADSQGNFTVPVYDSARLPHANDTRGKGEGGIGSGRISFQVDAKGRPTAFQFAPLKDFETLPIAIGRFEPLP